MPLSPEAVTVAQVLKGAGYATALIGKWGLGVQGTAGDPLKKGFDSYYGFLDQVRAHNSFPDFLLRNGEKEYLKNKPTFLPATHWSKGRGSYTMNKVDYANDLFTKEALNYIGEKKKEPFFLYLSYTTPHDNGEAPPGKQIEAHEHGRYANRPGWNENEKSYAAIITRLDEQIGQLVAKLQQEGIAEKTLIIFTCDNGPEHYGIEKFNSNGSLRGLKRDLYEGGIRMPFIAYWPGKIKKAVVHTPIAFWDFMLTARELAGAESLVATDGISFVPALFGKRLPERPFLYFELIEASTKQQAVRMGDWKAIKIHKASGTVTELYNLRSDIGEQNNVAAQYPDIVKQAEGLFLKERTPDKNWPLAPQ
jgi:arylsulfatase A-like enzyme